jgi:hypothetical protein
VPPLPRRYRSGEPALDPSTRLSSRATIFRRRRRPPPVPAVPSPVGRQAVGEKDARLLPPLPLPLRRVVADKTAHPPARLRFAVRCGIEGTLDCCVGTSCRSSSPAARGPPEAIPFPPFAARTIPADENAPLQPVSFWGRSSLPGIGSGRGVYLWPCRPVRQTPPSRGEIKRSQAVKQQTSFDVMTTSMPFWASAKTAEIG